MSGRRVAVITALVVLIGAVSAAVGWVVWPRDSDFEKAAALLPPDTLRVTWTDWARLRDEVSEADFASAVTDRDLSVSSLAASAGELREAFGFDPLEADWELLGQSRDGMVLIIKVDDDLGDISERFVSAGYEKPSGDALDGAVWEGGADVLSGLGLSAPELQSVAFMEDDGLLVASDSAGYLRTAMKTVTGTSDGLDITPLSDHLDDDPLDATAFMGDHACEALAMSRADDAAQTVAAGLVEKAGRVSPLTGYLVALSAGERLSVVFGFANDDQASRNATSRAALATAEDPGQMLAYADLFSDAKTTADGEFVVLEAQANEESFPMSNLSSGPVLLATC